MDFFSNAARLANDGGSDDTEQFARAIENRFAAPASLPASLPTPLTLPRQRPRMASHNPSSASMASNASTSSTQPPSEFPAVEPASLKPWLDDPDALILDVRTFAAHQSARLPRAVPLSVPSTLLKRPAFGTEKLGPMLPTRAARARFAAWRAAPRVLVYDADSAALAPGSNLLGLLKKFKAEFKEEGRTQELAWLRGGMQAVWRDQHALVDESSLPPEDEDAPAPSQSAPSLSAPGVRPSTSPTQRRLGAPTLRAGALPMSAFSAASTTSQRAGSTHHAAYAANERLPAAAASNPFYDNVRQNLELSQGITERIPLKIGREAKARVHELPFAWLREIGRWAAVDGEGSDSDTSISSGEDETSGMEEPHQHVHFGEKDKEKAREGIAEGAEALAMQFYRIELGEQRRLMGVMEHHSRESGGPAQAEPEPPSPVSERKEGKKSRRRKRKADQAARSDESGDFPFSITAGIEKGAKNRYRNIWPFEHARVRLASRTHPPPPLPSLSPSISRSPKTTRPRGNSLMLSPTSPETSDDYVNASYVQPLGTNKRYIATQGPLPETFTDFWTLVWEQNVHVIVMLTREVEGATVKSGNYWSGEKFGPLRLKLISEEGALGKQGADGGADDAGGGYFNFPAPAKHSAEFVGEPGQPSANSSVASLGRESVTDSAQEPRRPDVKALQANAPDADADNLDGETTIRRVLELTHTRYPRAPPRRVVQLQYLAWPDMNVPASTGSILRLINQVEREVARAAAAESIDSNETLLSGSSETLAGSSSSGSRDLSSGSGPTSPGNESSASGSELDSKFGIQRRARQPPVLLHCSAGVGRTGGFIAVDAVLDGIRREMEELRQRAERGRSQEVEMGSSEEDLTREGSSEAMEVDENSGGSGDVPAAAPDLVMSLGNVHVPVAGEAPMEMDVDERAPWTSGDPKHAITRWEEPQPRTQKHNLESLRSPPPVTGSSPIASSSAIGSSPFPLSPPPPPRRRTPESSPGASSGMAAMNLDLSPPSKRPITPRIKSFNLGGAPAFSFNKDAGFNFTGKEPRMDQEKGFFGAKDAGPNLTTGGDQQMLNHPAQPTQAGYPTHAGQAPPLGQNFTGHRTKSGGSSGDSSGVGSGSGSALPSASGSVVGSSGESGGRSRRESSSVGGGLAGVGGMRIQSPYPTMLGQQGIASLGPPLFPFPAQAPSTSASPMPPSASVSGAPTRDESPASVSGASSGEGASSSGAGTGSSSAFDGMAGSTSATSASAKDSSTSLVKGMGHGSQDAGASASENAVGGSNAGSRASGSPDAVPTANPDVTMAGPTATESTTIHPTPESKSGPSDPSSKTEPSGVNSRAPMAQATNAKAAEAASRRAHVPLSDPRRTTPPTLDYAPPRALHDNVHRPVPLSGLDEPIRRVLEDMREQRMSLCQSLRQYVFVHRAVLEGALALVDAERARGGLRLWDDRGSAANTPGASGIEDVPVTMPLSASGNAKRGPSPTELAAPSEVGKPLGRRASAKRRKPRGSSSEDDRNVAALQ